MANVLPDALGNLFRIHGIHFEIIVINDGSTDSVKKVIGHYEKQSREYENISFLSLNVGRCGRAEAVNRGAEIARGLYFSLLDADDVIDHKELLKLWSCTQATLSDLVFGQFRITTLSGKTLTTRKLPSDTTKKQLMRKIAFSPVAPVHLNAALIHRLLFAKAGGFDNGLIRSQDKDLTLRILDKSDSFTVCGACHYLYRKHRIGRRKAVHKRFEWMWYRNKMIRKNFKGITMIVSLSIQFCYDLGKLIYETLIPYSS